MFSAKDFSVLYAVSFSYYNPRTEQPKRVGTFPLFLTFSVCKVNLKRKSYLSDLKCSLVLKGMQWFVYDSPFSIHSFSFSVTLGLS